MHRYLVVLVMLAVGLAGCEPDWDAIADEIAASRPDLVRDVEYDAQDDFVTVTVANDTSNADALSLSCDTIQPILDEAGSIALHAVYTESGRILTSWNRCLLPGADATPAATR